MNPPGERPLLPDGRRRPVAIVSVLAALTVVVVAWLVAGDHRAASFDRAVIAGDHRAAAFDRAVRPGAESTTVGKPRWALALDFLGEPVGLTLLVVLLVAVSLALRRPRVATLVVLGTGLTISVTTALKPVVGRTIHGIYLSYPSGHTASATAMAMVATVLVWHRLSRAMALTALYGAASVVGATAAWAQLSLTAHYPSDTLGGWCTALAVIPTTAWVVDQAALRWPASHGATGLRDRGP